MALVLKDRVKVTTTTQGTGTLTLGSAVAGFQDFSVIGNENTTYYAIVDVNSGDWEVGLGTYTASGTTLSRDSILESSNAGSAVDLGVGEKLVFVTYPAEKSVYLDGSGNASPLGTVASGTWQGTTVGVAYGGTGQTTYTDGQLLIGNSTGNTLAKATLTAGTGISITNGSGSISIAATNNGTVTSVDVSGGTTGLTFTDGPITTNGTITMGGTLAATNGGTGLSSLGTGIATFLGTPSSANLASAVTDETGSGALVFATTPVLTGSRVTVSALGTLTTGTTTVDLATAQVFTATITASNTITFAFSNAPSASQSQVVIFRLTDAGGGTIAWPANTKFVAGTAPAFTVSGVDVLGIYYDVTTTTYMVFVIGLDVKVPA